MIKRKLETAGVIVGVAALFYAYSSYKQDMKIAVSSGAFEQSDIRVSIGKFDLDEEHENYIVIGTPKNRAAEIHSSPITFYIENKGLKTAKGINFTFKYPKASRMVVRSDKHQVKRIGNGVIAFDKSTSSIDTIDVASFYLEKVQPKMTVLVSENIRINTSLIGSIGTVSKCVKVKTSLTANDMLPRFYNLNICPVFGDSKEEISESYKDVIIDLMNAARSETNIFQYIIDLLRTINQRGQTRLKIRNFLSY